jgi:hypothetical protein
MHLGWNHFKKAMVVKLESYEVDLGTFVGKRRYEESLRMGKKDAYGFNKSADVSRMIDVEGACGEVAFAKAMNFYYSGSVNTFKKGGDVGRIQVRTRSRHDYDLLIRNNDNDSSVFVLVTGKIPEYIVHGWIYAKECKKKEYLKDYGNRPAAYFVPKSILKPLNTLYKEIVVEHYKNVTKP